MPGCLQLFHAAFSHALIALARVAQWANHLVPGGGQCFHKPKAGKRTGAGKKYFHFKCFIYGIVSFANDAAMSWITVGPRSAAAVPKLLHAAVGATDRTGIPRHTRVLLGERAGVRA